VLAQLALATSNVSHSSNRVSRSAVAATAREQQRLVEEARRILRGSHGRLSREQSSLEEVRRRISRAGSRQTTAADTALDRMTGSIGLAAHRVALQAENRLDEIEHRIELLEPARLLARGWSITRTVEGVLVVDPDDVAVGTKLLTTVAGGRIDSVVVDDEEVGCG